MSLVQIIDSSSKIRSIFENKYEYIYVSIGSKINTPSITGFSTNALSQIIPTFLYIIPEQIKILIISIDIFNEGELVQNRNALHPYLTSMSNMDCFIVNMNCRSPKFEILCENIISKVKEQNIPEEHFWLCNYIKFMNSPNISENDAFNKAINIPRKILNNDDNNKYKSCYYQWYGYRKSTLFNCIYRDNSMQHVLQFPINIVQIEKLLTKSTESTQSTGKRRFSRNLQNILSNSYSITDYSFDTVNNSLLSLDKTI